MLTVPALERRYYWRPTLRQLYLGRCTSTLPTLVAALLISPNSAAKGMSFDRAGIKPVDYRLESVGLIEGRTNES